MPAPGKFRDQSWKLGTYLSTFFVCALWGAILIMGVTDPLMLQETDRTAGSLLAAALRAEH